METLRNGLMKNITMVKLFKGQNERFKLPSLSLRKEKQKKNKETKI